MNKYQEALDKLFMLATNGYCALEVESEEFNYLKNTIQELVEKSTPKKPSYEGDGYSDGHIVLDTWICPCCGKDYEVDYDEYDYCPNCGQAIDMTEMSDEE